MGVRRLRMIAAVVVLLAAVLGGVWAAALIEVDAGAQDDDQLRITATTSQITDLVSVLGGDRVEVTGLMGPGVDPHLYQVSEGDIQTLAEAEIIFYNGLNLEGRMGDLLDTLSNDRPVVAVAENIPEENLLTAEAFQGEADPHVWFDPTLWAMAAEAVHSALAEADPVGADLYQENLDAYLAALATLDEESMAMIETIPEAGRVLVTAHDAFGYFGRRYGFEVVGIQGLSTESEAGISDIERVADLIAERGIPAIFVESTVNTATIDAVQAAVADRGAEVVIGGQLFSDAMGEADTPEGTYLGMFRYNVATIVEALGAGS